MPMLISMLKDRLMCARLNSAQSLIETIVAIGIVVTAIVAILSLGLTHLTLGGASSERVIAINLSREGIEVIHAIRDSNWLDPDQSWPYGLTPNDDYILNYNATSLTAATFDGAETIENCTNCYLCQDLTYDYYTHTDCVVEEVFRRMITISAGDDLGGNCSADCEKKIVSTVYWTEHENEHSVSIETRFTDWR